VDILKIFFGVFLYCFSGKRLDALLINRLYHVSENSGNLINKINRASAAGKKSNKLQDRPNGDVAIGVPRWLDWEYLMYILCCFYKVCRICGLKRFREFKAYNGLIDLGMKNFQEDMDVIRYIRRARIWLRITLSTGVGFPW